MKVPSFTYEPNFEISEVDMPDIGDKQIGQRLQAVLNYEVIEKTKSFTILRINFAHLLPVSRKF